MAQCFVSVIVPVLKDEVGLGRTIAALGQQTYDPTWFEVLIVDNAETDDDAVAIGAFPPSGMTIRWLRETRPGSYAARNCGMGSADGAIIAFTDADCVPDPHWIESGVQAIETGQDCGQVAGRIILMPEDAARPRMAERYQIFTQYDTGKLLARRHFAATANMFTTRNVVDNVGVFNDRLMSGGDLEWGLRIRAYGYRQVYCERAVVFHRARLSVRALIRQTRRVAGGRYQLHKVIAARRQDAGRRDGETPSIARPLATPGQVTYNLIKQHMTTPGLLGGVICIGAMLRIVAALETLRLKAGGQPLR